MDAQASRSRRLPRPNKEVEPLDSSSIAVVNTLAIVRICVVRDLQSNICSNHGSEMMLGWIK